MNQFIKVFSVVALAAVLTVVAFGQAAGPAGGGVQGGTQGAGGKQGKAGALRGGQKLEQAIFAKISPPLDARQKAELDRINAKAKDSMKALRAKVQGGDKSALKGELQKIQEERRNSLKGLLTAEQQKSYMALMKEAMEKLRKERGGKGGNKIG
jgi:Spy/CpxP family protein refolding chaperone